jgi:argininosuccinate lyase
VDSRFGDDTLEVFNYERSVEVRFAIGGTSKSAAKE